VTAGTVARACPWMGLITRKMGWAVIIRSQRDSPRSTRRHYPLTTFTSQGGGGNMRLARITEILGADRWHGCRLTLVEIGLISAHVLAYVPCPCLCRIGVFCVQLLRSSGSLMRVPLARAATGHTERNYAGPALGSVSHHPDGYGMPLFQKPAWQQERRALESSSSAWRFRSNSDSKVYHQKSLQLYSHLARSPEQNHQLEMLLVVFPTQQRLFWPWQSATVVSSRRSDFP
jgi:hypothetical protein